MTKFLFLFLFLFVCGYLQGQVLFGENGGNEIKKVILTKSNQLLLLCSTKGFPVGKDEILVIKTDLDGAVLDSVRFANDKFIRPKSITELSDGNFLISGWKWVDTPVLKRGDAFFIKIDANLDQVWTNNYGLYGLDEIADVCQMSKNRIWGVGFMRSIASDFLGDIYMLKTDRFGNELDYFTFSNPYQTDFAAKIIKNDDNSMIIAGTVNTSYGSAQYVNSASGNILLLKIDTLGHQVLKKYWGGTENEYVSDLLKVSPISYILCGSTQSYGNGSFDMLIMKFGTLFNTNWVITSGGTRVDKATSIALDNSGQFVYVAGYSEDEITGDYHSKLLKISMQGELVWGKLFQGDFMEYTNSLCVLPDNSIIMAGRTKGYGSQKYDGFLRKINNEGFDITTIKLPINNKKQELVYPNPTNDFYCIDALPKQLGKDAILSVFNIYGKLVEYKLFETDKRIAFGRKLNSGVYFYQISIKNKVLAKGKLVKN